MPELFQATRAKVVAIVVAVVLVIAATTLWLERGAALDPHAQAQWREVELHTGGEAGERPYIEAVRQAIDALPASLATGSADGLTQPLAHAVTDLAKLWPPDARTELDQPTWGRTGDIVTVRATVTSSAKTTKVLLTLSFEGGRWRLLNAEGVPS